MTLRNALVATTLAALCGLASAVNTAAGLVAQVSPHSVSETMNRLEAVVRARNLNVFLRLNHAAGAASIGKVLRPTELLVFGNPQGGTPFMECEQTVGIDLPLKALVWQDAAGVVWLGYNDPAYIAKRHDAKKCPSVDTLSAALQAITAAALAP